MPRVMVPDLSIRLREAFRWLAIQFSLYIALLLHGTAVIWEGADEGVHRSPLETMLLEWEKPRPSPFVE